MARTREFEPDEALTAAMRVFWVNGFENTSYDDLVNATGVSRKGLYTVFGDKRALFEEALKHYRATVVPEIFTTLSKQDVTVKDIAEMLRGLAKMAANGEGARGCLMANSAGDAVIRRPEIQTIFDSHLRRLSAEFTGAFERAGVEQGRAEQLGCYYVGVMQALLLMAHARADGGLIMSFVETALKELEG
ncbi:MAG: TetR/AcrR family transcriptional regulator [Pseudomonadota bacterium]